jgi:glycosyltransferase involved in cell wall biosynthesis
MRIAVAGVITKPITSHPLGGTEAFTYLLVKGLVERGHEVTLYCASGSETKAQHHEFICSPQEAMGEESNVEFVYPFTLLEIRKISEDIAAGKFDILHVNILKTFMFSYFTGQIKLPVLHTIHRDFMASQRLYEVYKKIGFHANEHFAFVSERAMRLSILRDNIHMVYNGINTDEYPFAPASNQQTYLWLSRVDPLKGPKEAVLAAKNADVPLLLSGDVDRKKYLDYFDSDISPLLSDKIRFEKPSNMDRKVELYRQAKAYVFPIQWEEPFGLVVIEAMSCGTPVITFNRGAMAELVENGVNGFLVPQEEGVDGISKAMRKIESMTPETYAVMRENCRKTAETKFSYKKTVAGYESLYLDMISQMSMVSK